MFVAVRLAGAVAVLAVVLLAHGLQCVAAAPSVHGSPTVDHVMVVGLPGGIADAMVSPDTPPAVPTHTAGHAVAVCFAVIAAVIVLLLRRGLNWSVAALARSAPRRRASARIAVARWRANALPLAVLCVSRT